MKFVLIAMVMGLVFMSAALVIAGETQPEEPLLSPYFVDEVHCQGTRSHDVFGQWLMSDEEREAAEKIEQQESCESILKIFGIEKYMWLSPDDLERTSALIKQSEFFKEADLSVKKSEMKNHVHLFLKVVPQSRTVMSFSNHFKYYSDYKGPTSESSRLYDQISGELVLRPYAPIRQDRLGVTFERTSATTPPSPDISYLPPEDVSELQRKSRSLVDLYWKSENNLTKWLSFNTGLHWIEDTSRENHHAFTVDADLLFTKPVNVIKGKFFAGPTFLLVNSTSDYESRHNTFFSGIIAGYSYGKDFGNNFNFKITSLLAPSDRSIIEYDLNGQKHLSSTGLIFLGGAYSRTVRNAVLPQDLYPYTGTNRNDLFVGLAKAFSADKTKHQVSAVAGLESLGYSRVSPYGSSFYLGPRYKLVSGDWNLNLAADYHFERTY